MPATACIFLGRQFTASIGFSDPKEIKIQPWGKQPLPQWHDKSRFVLSKKPLLASPDCPHFPFLLPANTYEYLLRTRRCSRLWDVGLMRRDTAPPPNEPAVAGAADAAVNQLDTCSEQGVRQAQVSQPLLL